MDRLDGFKSAAQIRLEEAVMLDKVNASRRRLTEVQRQQLYRSAEWCDLQLGMRNVSAYLALTRLEDIQMQAAIETLQDLSQRRAACLERCLHNQGGM